MPTKPRTRRQNPRHILAEIANDPTASVAVRCRAAKALLAAEPKPARAAKRTSAAPEVPAPEAEQDPIMSRALELAAARTRSLN